MLDVNLPDGNGFDFCREVKERRPDTAVIFLTANDMESDMLKGYELGAEDYVTKPFPMSVFQKKLSVVLGRLAKQSGGGDCYEDIRTRIIMWRLQVLTFIRRASPPLRLIYGHSPEPICSATLVMGL